MQMNYRRGQAYIETVIFLPVFLTILFGIIWVVKASVANERLQLAARYSGLVSSQVSSFSGWSLYSLYANSEGMSSTVTHVCSSPNPALLTDASPLPGPTSAPFWSPQTVVAGSPSPAIVKMTSGFGQPAIFTDCSSTITATTNVPAYLSTGQNTMPTLQNLSAEQKFFSPPDLNTLLKCYTQLNTAVQQSLQGNGGGLVVTAPFSSSGPPALTITAGGC